MSYIPFTEQQREQARRTDLAAFLRQCGEEVKRSGSENMWLDHGQKVTIRGNLWFHQYEQVGGDAIDFARRFYNMEYPEAVQLMLAMGAATIREPVEPFSQKPLEIPQKHENMRRVYGYLLRHRGIDKEELDAFSYRGLSMNPQITTTPYSWAQTGRENHGTFTSTALLHRAASREMPPAVSRNTASTGSAVGRPCFCLKLRLTCCRLFPCTNSTGNPAAMPRPAASRTRCCGRQWKAGHSSAMCASAWTTMKPAKGQHREFPKH